MNRSLIALLCLAACGVNPADYNDGDMAELAIHGDDQPLPVEKRSELNVYRTETGPSDCQYDVTRLASYCTTALIDKILEASCERDACTTFIVDDYTVDVTGHVAGMTRFTVKVQLADGGIVEDSTTLTFVNP